MTYGDEIPKEEPNEEDKGDFMQEKYARDIGLDKPAESVY